MVMSEVINMDDNFTVELMYDDGRKISLTRDERLNNEFLELGLSRETWKKNNKVHRDDGPAEIIYKSDGRAFLKTYYHEGYKISDVFKKEMDILQKGHDTIAPLVSHEAHTYTISISGKGCEVTTWNVTEEQFEFWEEDEELLVDYESGNLASEIDPEFDFLGDASTTNEPTVFHGPILEGVNHAIHIKDDEGNMVVDGHTYEDLLKKGIGSSIKKPIFVDEEYYCVFENEDKGEYVSFRLNLPTSINFRKLQFHMAIMSERKTLITGVSYDGTALEPVLVGDTDSQSYEGYCYMG